MGRVSSIIESPAARQIAFIASPHLINFTVFAVRASAVSSIDRTVLSVIAALIFEIVHNASP